MRHISAVHRPIPRTVTRRSMICSSRSREMRSRGSVRSFTFYARSRMTRSRRASSALAAVKLTRGIDALAVVRELKRDPEVLFFQVLDRALQEVPALSRNAHLLFLDRRLHLEPAALQ